MTYYCEVKKEEKKEKTKIRLMLSGCKYIIRYDNKAIYSFTSSWFKQHTLRSLQARTKRFKVNQTKHFHIYMQSVF